MATRAPTSDAVAGGTEAISRKRQQGLETKRRILDAAGALMAERGYAATSISMISTAADAPPTSIYWAFGSKEGLFAAVIDRAADRWFAEQSHVLVATDLADFWARFRTLAASFVDGPEFLRLMLVLSLERRDGDPEIVRAAQRVREIGASAVADTLAPLVRLADVERRREICHEIGRLAIVLLDGTFVARQIDVDADDIDQAFVTITDCLAATLALRLRETRRSANRGKQ